MQLKTINNIYYFSSRLAESPSTYSFANVTSGQAIEPVQSYSSGNPVIVTDGTDLTYLYLPQVSILYTYNVNFTKNLNFILAISFFDPLYYFLGLIKISTIL